MDEAETGLKSALAVKIFGSDLNLLAEKAAQVKDILTKTRGITEITVVRETGQPSLVITPDRAKLARYGLNVSDINTLIGTAMGGQAATQVIQGERQFDLIVRMQEPYPQRRKRHPQPAGRDARRAVSALEPVLRHSARRAARRSFIGRPIRAISEFSSASRGATWRAR